MANEQKDSRGEARQSFFARQQLIDSSRTTFQLMAAVVRNATLYPESHPIMFTGADKLRRKIGELMAGRKEVAFYLVGGELFFEKISIPLDQSLAVLIEQFAEREVGGITFRPGLTAEELIGFAGVMNRDQASLNEQGGISSALIRSGIKDIELHRVMMVDKQEGNAPRLGKQKTLELFRNAVDTVKEMVHAVQLDKAFNARKMTTIVQTMVDNILDNRDAYLGLTSLKVYDEYTFAHSVNVSILAVSLGTYLSFEKPQLAALGVAALMHDIGKVNIPKEIINKPDKLTNEEWDALKRHPVEGALILAGTLGISKLAMVAAFEHHRHGSANDYPRLEGDQHRHPFSQIVSLADAYEAITAARVYYSVQIPVDEAVRILLKKRGAPFNPVLVNTFVKMIGVFPAGTLVKLDTGEIAMVKTQTNNLLRPHVLILKKFDGSEKENPLTSLLETSGGRYKRSIAGTIDPHAARLDIKKYLD